MNLEKPIPPHHLNYTKAPPHQYFPLLILHFTKPSISALPPLEVAYLNALLILVDHAYDICGGDGVSYVYLKCPNVYGSFVGFLLY